MGKKYCVLTIYNEELNTYTKAFVPPVKKVAGVIDDCSEYERIVGIEYGDYSFYLNQKLNYEVQEYNEIFKFLQDTLVKTLNGEYSMRLGADTFNCAMTNLEASEKKIGMLFKKMLREDFTIENEEAFTLYDMIKKKERSI